MKQRPSSNVQSTSARREFLRESLAAGAFLAAPGSLSAGPLPQGPHSANPPGTPGFKFRRLLDGPGLVMSPVIFDVMSAKLAALRGFPTVFAGGMPTAASMFGLGDYGMITVSELIEFAGRIAEAVDVPVMADGDDLGGNPLNAYRAMQRYERAGVACVMLEDMTGAKHLPGLPEGPVISKEAMVDRIRAAADARRDESLAILARCDALSAGQSWDQALERSVAYCEAGADLTFVPRMRIEDASKLAAATKKPVAASATEAGRYIPPAELERLNVKVAIYAAQFPNLALGAVDEAFKELKATGGIANYAKRAIAPDVYARLIDAETSVAVARKYNANRP